MLIERRILKQVSLLPEQHAINVQWADQIVRDDGTLAAPEAYHRKAYTQSQSADFEAEVEGAASYMAAIGW